MTNRRTNDLGAALGELRELHALGREISALSARPNSPKIEVIAEQYGMPVQRTRDLEIFAEKFSAAELAELCRECRDGGYVLSYRHVVRLLAVTPKSARRRLQRDAIRNRWTVAQLNFALKQRGATADYRERLEVGAKMAGYVRGKPPRAVESVAALQAQISVDAVQWRRIVEFLKWRDAIDPEGLPTKTSDFLSWSELSRGLQANLRDLVSLWDKLNDGAGAKRGR